MKVIFYYLIGFFEKPVFKKTLKTIFGVVLFSCFFMGCKKNGDYKAETYNFERSWISNNGGIYKNETLVMKSIDGSIKTASLNWSAVRKFKVGQVNYTEIPFSFLGGGSPSQTNVLSSNDISFSFMIRVYGGKTEAAIKFTHRNVKIKISKTEKLGIVEGYSTLEGAQLNMYFTDDEGKLMTIRKQSLADVKINSHSEIALLASPVDCISVFIPTYEYHCWITGGSYNDTACGWLLVGGTQYNLCFGGGDDVGGSGGGGGSDWPPTGGGNSPTPPANTPCGGDALVNPTVAPSSASNKNGGRFGPTRRYPDGSPKIHKGIDLSAVPNTAVYAAYGGVVLRSISTYPSNYYGGPTSFGNLVEIQTTLPNGSTFTTLYAHLNSASVPVGNTISAGDQIGLSGRTGNAQHVRFPHVHLQIRQNGVLVDPEPFLATKFDSQGNSLGRPCN